MRNWILFGLLLAGLLVALPARAFGECTATGYVAAFDRTGLPNNTCYEIARAPIRHSSGSGTIRLLGVVGERGFQSQDAMAAALQDLAGRIGKISNARIVFITAQSALEDRVRALHVGSEYLIRPFEPEELRLRLEMHISNR